MGFTYAQQMNVATFNIRQKNNVDTGNMWDDRKSYLTELIKFHEFEIFGVQEAFKDQLNDMSANLPNFKYIGVEMTVQIKASIRQFSIIRIVLRLAKVEPFGYLQPIRKNLIKVGMQHCQGSAHGESLKINPTGKSSFL